MLFGYTMLNNNLTAMATDVVQLHVVSWEWECIGSLEVITLLHLPYRAAEAVQLQRQRLSGAGPVQMSFSDQGLIKIGFKAGPAWYDTNYLVQVSHPRIFTRHRSCPAGFCMYCL